MANVLVACELSGTVRDAFLRAGHHAISCDLEPTESTGPISTPTGYVQGADLHHTGDVREVLNHPEKWFTGPIHLMVAHPPCTFLANSGAKHLNMLDGNHTRKDADGNAIPNPQRWADLRDGAAFFRLLWEADVPRIAVENPVMMGHAKRLLWDHDGEPMEPHQSFQPWEFGHPEKKRTCLWLKGLPPLKGTKNVKAEADTLPLAQQQRVWRMAPGPNRQRERSYFFTGVADAMAAQWGPLADEDAKAQVA